MKDSDKPEFTIVIGALFEAFGQESTKARLFGYWMGLHDLELASIHEAVGGALRTKQRLPAPAELRELAGEVKPADRSIIAWNDFLGAVSIGPWRWVDFEDEVINATIRVLGGWPAMISRLSDTESEKWTRIEFEKTYTVLANRGVDGDMTQPLKGLSEKEVVEGRLHDPVPRLIRCNSVPRIGAQVRIKTKLLQVVT